jgi:hypothetical protein
MNGIKNDERAVDIYQSLVAGRNIETFVVINLVQNPTKPVLIYMVEDSSFVLVPMCAVVE